MRGVRAPRPCANRALAGEAEAERRPILEAVAAGPGEQLIETEYSCLWAAGQRRGPEPRGAVTAIPTLRSPSCGRHHHLPALHLGVAENDVGH